MMIRFDLEDFDGNTKYAEYRTFYIDGENDNYRLHVSSYSGTAGDSLSYHNGMEFSTKDRDNDRYGSGSCSSDYHGAWWHKSCHYSNLNGKYLHGRKLSASGVLWYHLKGNYDSLRQTEIKVRPTI